MRVQLRYKRENWLWGPMTKTRKWGRLVTAAGNITPEVINFMSKHGRGLICAALPEERCDELGLELMVNNNTALHETAFTISVDLLGHGCTTGISAHDRAKTIQALIDPFTTVADLGRPVIFSLRQKREVYSEGWDTEAPDLHGWQVSATLRMSIVDIMNEVWSRQEHQLEK